MVLSGPTIESSFQEMIKVVISSTFFSKLQNAFEITKEEKKGI